MRAKGETQLHFVGIGGVGMSGIAEVFLNQGYRVTGSDLGESETTQRLSRLGARVQVGHRAEQVHGAHVVVISSAVKADNPEVVEARRRRIPVIPRAEMLGELMRGKHGIAVAGSHGKTTTTSMLATVLSVAGLDPTLVIGGKVDTFGGGARLGQGRLVLAEADESDGSFLHLPATHAVVTNIDDDHLDHYGAQARIDDAFVDFVGKLPFYGRAVVCADDPGVRRVLPRFSKPVLTYGMSPEADLSARDIRHEGLGSSFEVHSRLVADRHPRALGRARLNVPGVHNVLNALAALGIAQELDLSFEAAVAGLAEFQGVRRRFEVRWQDPVRRRAIVDDYGHHPTEIAATLAAAARWWRQVSPGGRIVVVFQPHRYSRTLHCREGFLTAFHDADLVLLTEIYAAGEAPIPGVDGATLAADVRGRARPGQEVLFSAALEDCERDLGARLRDGDLVICMGAGTITKLPDRLVPA